MMSFRIARRIVQGSPSLRCLSSSRNAQIHGSVTTDNIKKEMNIPPVDVPKEADVVVIGGGSAGCSTLYHLAKLGVTNTVLLEAHQLTAGTTWHTAGIVMAIRPTDVEMEIIRITRETILKLEEETGVNPGWINNGSMTVAPTKERLDEFKRLMTLARSLNIESFILDSTETQKLYPLMNVSDVYGTLYIPGDGTVEPTGLCTALTRFATTHGAKVIENCPVTAIQLEPTLFDGQQVKAVTTPYGDIKTSKVINATGCWASYIASMVGTTIPLVSMKHAYVVTEKIPGIENMPNLRECKGSLYMKLQGQGLAFGPFELNPVILDKVSKDDLPFTLYDFDWNMYSPYIQGGINRIPSLANIGIKSTICGPESFTPDHKPIMGEDPNVNGFYHFCGLSSGGIMMGGGCGNQMAHWVVRGRPELDMFSFDIRRFDPSLIKNKDWVTSKTHERFTKKYSPLYPHDEPLAGRGQKKFPLHDILEEQGCIFQERNGWERPSWFNTYPAPVQPYDWYGAYDTPLNADTRYKDVLAQEYTFSFPSHHDIIKEECMAARCRAALFDMSGFGQIFITGPDAQKTADWLFSANVQKNVGSVVYTCMLNDKGGAEADLTVSILDGSDTCNWEPAFEGRGFYLTVGSAVLFHVKAHILKECRRNSWNVNLIDCTNNMGVLSLQGPKSRELLQQLTDTELCNEAFPFLTHKIINIAGQRVRAMRVSFIGEMGWELHIPEEAALPIYKSLHSFVKTIQLANAGYRALDSLSCEKGYHLWHADLRMDDTPFEAGLEFVCKLKTSTPFLGRDALERQRKENIKKKLLTFSLQDPSVCVLGNERILRNGETVGHVQRADFAFYLGTSIARGYVKMPALSTDILSTGEWEIDVMGEKYPVTLHLNPPFDPKNLRIKGIYNE